MSSNSGYSVDITDVLVDISGPVSQLSFKILFKRRQSPKSNKPAASSSMPSSLDSYLDNFTSVPTEPEQFTRVRTFTQLVWLHSKLSTNHSQLFIPPFPEKPSTSDHDYVEKKRLQMQRYLQKVFSRREFEQDADARYFLSADMAELRPITPPITPSTPPSSTSKRVTLANSVLNTASIIAKTFIPFVSKANESYRGITIPVLVDGDIDGVDDIDEFSTREGYILTMEDFYAEMLDKFSLLVKTKESNAKTLLRAGHAFKENFSTLSTDSLKFYDELYDFCTNMKGNVHNQMKEEIWYFGDVQLEYKNSMNCLKKVMNERTALLNRYISCVKSKGRKQDKLKKLMEDPNSTTYAYDISDAELALKRADEDVFQSKDDYMKMKNTLTKEMVRFEREKCRDIRESLEEYAKIQIKFENQRLKAAQMLLKEWGFLEQDDNPQDTGTVMTPTEKSYQQYYGLENNNGFNKDYDDIL